MVLVLPGRHHRSFEDEAGVDSTQTGGLRGHRERGSMQPGRNYPPPAYPELNVPQGRAAEIEDDAVVGEDSDGVAARSIGEVEDHDEDLEVSFNVIHR